MNKFFILFFAATLAASSVCHAAPETGPKIAYAATQSGPIGALSDAVHRGSHRADVIAKIGLPDTQLSPDVWVYWQNYRCDDASAGRLGCDTLIVTFATDRVADLKLVNAQTLATALARRNQGDLAVHTAAPSR